MAGTPPRPHGAQHTVAPPPGFFTDDEGVTRRPGARMRITKSAFGPSRTIELVAHSCFQPGETILEEIPLLEWDTSLSAVVSPRLPSNDAEKALVQRCLAMKLAAEKMPAAGKYAPIVVPLVYGYCISILNKKTEAKDVWSLPWQLRDTAAPPEVLKNRGGFCVLAHKGLSKTLFESYFTGHEQIARLCVLADEGAVPLSKKTQGLCRFLSLCRRLDAVDRSQLGMGNRPGQVPKLCVPNADYEVLDDGRVVLRATRLISFGDVIAIPKTKTFADSGPRKPLEVLQDKATMRDAIIHKAAQADAPDTVKAYATSEHPFVPPRFPPHQSLNMPKRDVTRGVWKEELHGKATSTSFAYYIDHAFEAPEIASLTAFIATEGKPQRYTFHVGFEQSVRQLQPGPVLTTTLTAVFTRVQPFLPTSFRGLPLHGMALNGCYMRLTPGEELLKHAVDPPQSTESASLPMLLMLSEGSGKVVLHPPSTGTVPVDVATKVGRLLVFDPATKFEVPVATKDVVFFVGLVAFSKPPGAQPS